MSTYQMLWDCPRCDTPKLLGLDHRFCPACGAPQDPQARYFPEEADKVAVEDHPFAGADLRCDACDAPNASASEHCGACGAPLDEAHQVQRREAQTSDTAGVFEADTARQASAEHREHKRTSEAARRSPDGAQPQGDPDGSTASGQASRLGCGLAAAGAAALLALFCVVAMFWTTEASFTVEGHTWERTIPVQAQQLVRKSDWKDRVPSAARDVSCQQKKRGTKKVADGETCKTVRSDNGDGTFSEREKCTTNYRSEPTYDDHCTYRVREWTTVRTARAGGSSLDPSPAWPAVRIDAGEREGTRTEHYRIQLRDGEGERHECAFDQARWKTFTVGQSLTGAVGMVGGGVRCGTLVSGS